MTACRPNLNALFSECVDALSESHHIKVVYALQTLSGLVRAASRRTQAGGAAGGSTVDLVNLIVGFDSAEIKMQSLIAHITE